MCLVQHKIYFTGATLHIDTVQRLNQSLLVKCLHESIKYVFLQSRLTHILINVQL